jgi:hypothetical protein
MSSPLDLSSIQAVKVWLSQNAAPTAVVSTSIALPILAGNQTVTPASMANIVVGSQLAIDSGIYQEIVAVTAVTSTTFTAAFAIAHAAGATVTLAADAVLPGLITSVSLYFLRQTGRGPADGSIPSQSPFVQPVAYNENYDGSGSDVQFVRNWPITSVTSVQVNGFTLPQSTASNVPGWLVDGTGKCLAIRSGVSSPSYGYGWSGSYQRRGGFGYQFFYGRQNVNVQYTAGFSVVPYDIVEAVTETIGLIQRQRSWIGLKSQALAAGGGTVVYDNVAIPKRMQLAIEFYARRAVV